MSDLLLIPSLLTSSSVVYLFFSARLLLLDLSLTLLSFVIQILLSAGINLVASLASATWHPHTWNRK